MKKIDLIEKYNIPILYEDNHLFVCIKPEGILSQADSTNDIDMLTIIKEYLKDKYHKNGNVYLGLVHRLDRRVSGVMVFAKSSKGASRLSEQIRLHQFEKKYLGIIDGYLTGSGKLENDLEKIDNKSINNDEIESESGKKAQLEYEIIDHISLDRDVFSIALIDLKTGRYNQIRKQFSIINHPLINDYKYDYKKKNYNNHIGLFCIKISFNHPTTKERMTFENYLIEEIKKDWIKYFEVKSEK